MSATSSPPPLKKLKSTKVENLCDASSATKTVFFSKAFNQRDLRLIEVTQDIADRVQKGEILKIVGTAGGNGKASEAVLCTNDKTFSIKKVETSNSVFLIPPLFVEVDNSTAEGKVGVVDNIKFSIESQSRDYYELKQISGKVDQLEGLLRKSQYKLGETPEEMDKLIEDGSLLTRKQLLDSVQASKGELEAAFVTHGVVEIGGYMRILSKVTLRDITRNLLDEIIENGWQLDKIDQDECISKLCEIDEALVILTLSRLGDRIKDDSQTHGNHQLWCLNQAKVAKASANILFQNYLQENALSLKKGWPCEDFMMAWERHTPGATPTEDLLDGIAVKVNGMFEYSNTN